MNHRPPRRRRPLLAMSIVVVTAATGYAYLRHHGPEQGRGVEGGTTVTQPVAAPSPAPAPASPRSPTAPPVPATAEAALQLLVQLLPPGGVTSFATSEQPDSLVAEVHHTRENATNAVRAAIVLRPPPAGDTCTTTGPVSCMILPSNAVLRLSRTSNCHGAMVAQVDHTDGTRVRIELDSCPHIAEPDASVDHPTVQANTLSAAEIQLIAADDQWGRTMPAGLTRDGLARFADAPEIRGRRADPDR